MKSIRTLAIAALVLISINAGNKIPQDHLAEAKSQVDSTILSDTSADSDLLLLSGTRKKPPYTLYNKSNSTLNLLAGGTRKFPPHYLYRKSDGNLNLLAGGTWKKPPHTLYKKSNGALNLLAGGTRTKNPHLLEDIAAHLLELS